MCLDAVLFVKVARNLLHHIRKERKSFVSFESEGLFLSNQCFLDFGDGSSTPDFTCLDGVQFVKVAQTLLHHI